MGGSTGGIERTSKEVCRNLIESMPRRIEAEIKAKEAQTKYKQKTVPSKVPYCKIYNKTMAWTKLLDFGVAKEGMSTFVMKFPMGLPLLFEQQFA